jgi:hypothetical protein
LGEVVTIATEEKKQAKRFDHSCGGMKTTDMIIK